MFFNIYAANIASSAVSIIMWL